MQALKINASSGVSPASSRPCACAATCVAQRGTASTNATVLHSVAASNAVMDRLVTSGPDRRAGSALAWRTARHAMRAYRANPRLDGAFSALSINEKVFWR
ncbi:hypothetical protein B0O95_106153 [Mycetohabitans endofungorum]|uniref:Uncharacterized protein n=1 Tax=Mycetohabitans endofungorum TaxID=417203 RepID=A0A2P5KAM6_9BURK|nr:hypothetical protein B0O95_106153 [Mycetohabitans endofungorum]